MPSISNEAAVGLACLPSQCHGQSAGSPGVVNPVVIGSMLERAARERHRKTAPIRMSRASRPRVEAGASNQPST
jgi:hypothetical protein